MSLVNDNKLSFRNASHSVLTLATTKVGTNRKQKLTVYFYTATLQVSLARRVHAWKMRSEINSIFLARQKEQHSLSECVYMAVSFCVLRRLNSVQSAPPLLYYNSRSRLKMEETRKTGTTK